MKEPLSADLVPEILAGSPSLFLVKVQVAHLVDHGDETPAMEKGTITFQIMEVFRSPAPAPTGAIEVQAHRIADPIKRAKYNDDQWNNLELTPGELLLLACQPLSPPGTWKALAAAQVDDVTSPDVAAMRRCIAIQKFSGPPEGKVELVGKALKSKEELLRRYALALASDGKTFPRETAVGLVADAIASPELDGAKKLELGSALTEDAFFKRSDKAGGTNPLAVTALTRGLVGATDAEERLDWVRYLASCVLGTLSPDPAKNRTVRAALIRKCPPPLAAQAHTALTQLTHQSQGDEQKMVRELLDAWGAAGTAP